MVDNTFLQNRRDKYFSLYDRGALTASETAIGFVELLIEAPDDDSALELCAGLPEWFQTVLRDSLHDLAATNYYRQWYGIGDSRTADEVHRDAIRHQEVLLRLAPRIRRLLKQAPAQSPVDTNGVNEVRTNGCTRGGDRVGK